MSIGKSVVLSLGVLATVSTSGCASRYFADPGCHVNCTYCPAPPLPYAHYSGCVCHSSAATPYLAAYPLPDASLNSGETADSND